MVRHSGRCWRTQKLCFDEVGAKLALVERARSDELREKTEVRCYRCPYCRKWHLTSRPDREAGSP